MEEGLLDNALQLFDVTGPAAGKQQGNSLRRKALLRQVVLRRHLHENMRCNNLNILHALTQRRYAHRCIENKLVQLTREQALVCQTLEVRVAGCDYAHIKHTRLAALFSRRQTVQQSLSQLVSHFRRQLLYLVEEQRAAHRQLQLACGLLLALVCTEELCLQLLNRRIAALHSNQRCSSAGACLMNAMCQTLLARARLALQQDIVLCSCYAASLMLQRQKLARFAHHAVQAVAAAVACCMGNRRFQILDRHGQHQRALHLTANLNRHNRGDILIGSVLRNPGNLAALRRHALERLLHRNMLIVQENVLQAVVPVQTLSAIFVAIFYVAVLAQPVNSYRQLLHHNLVDAPSLQHVQMLLDGIFHRQQQAQQQIIGQVILI